MTTYAQRYADGDSNTSGAFRFDTHSSEDFAVSKLAFGDTSNITRVDASNPLPVTISGVATAAKQPALGTAGSASSDVLTVQGIASMVALKVDGSAVTQPVSIAAAVAVTDNSGSLTVDDGGSSLTVDGTVGISGSVAVTDNSGSLTVDAPVGTPVFVRLSDGSTAISTLPVSIAAAVAVTDNSGSLTVDDGGSTLSIDDGAGSITVDGTVAISGSVAVTDNSGSLTVDAPVGTPVFVRLSDGSNAITTLPVSLAASVTVVGAAASGASKSGNPVQAGAVYNSTQPTVTTGQAVELQSTARGGLVVATGADTFNVTVNAALPAGTNAIGKLASNSGVTIGAVEIAASQTLATVSTVTTCSTVTNLSQLGGNAIAMGTGTRSSGCQRVTIATDDVVPASQSGTWTVQPGNTANTTAWLVSQRPATSGGLTMHRTISAASTNATSVKGSAGQLYDVECYNLNASPRYLKLYNKATSPTVGTDTPVRTILIPGNTAGGGVVRYIPDGLAFSTGIAFAITSGIGDSDTTAISANEVIVNLGYA